MYFQLNNYNESFINVITANMLIFLMKLVINFKLINGFVGKNKTIKIYSVLWKLRRSQVIMVYICWATHALQS